MFMDEDGFYTGIKLTNTKNDGRDKFDKMEIISEDIDIIGGGLEARVESYHSLKEYFVVIFPDRNRIKIDARNYVDTAQALKYIISACKSNKDDSHVYDELLSPVW